MEEKIQEKSGTDVVSPFWRSETILILCATIFLYLFTFSYAKSHASYYNIPYKFLEITAQDLIPGGIALMSLLLFLFNIAWIIPKIAIKFSFVIIFIYQISISILAILALVYTASGANRISATILIIFVIAFIFESVTILIGAKARGGIENHLIEDINLTDQVRQHFAVSHAIDRLPGHVILLAFLTTVTPYAGGMYWGHRDTAKYGTFATYQDGGTTFAIVDKQGASIFAVPLINFHEKNFQNEFEDRLSIFMETSLYDKQIVPRNMRLIRTSELRRKSISEFLKKECSQKTLFCLYGALD